MDEYWKELDKELFTEDVLQIHCDTRDFHCGVNKEEIKLIKDLNTLLKYKNQFFFTIEEVCSVLFRLFEESGGEATWRMLSFKENGNWFKYIRCYKTDHGYLIGNGTGNDTRYFKRSFWFEATVDNEYLHTH